MDDEEVLLDLGRHPGRAMQFRWMVATGVLLSVVTVVSVLMRSRPLPVLTFLVFLALWLANFGREIWQWGRTPQRVAVTGDGRIVLEAGRRTRSFPVRALICVERVAPDMYVLEWAPKGERLRVHDASGRLLPTVARLNPDAALLEIPA